MSPNGQLYLLIDVDIKEALRCATTRAGKIKLPLTVDILNLLPVEVREEAARYTVSADTYTTEQLQKKAWLPTPSLDATDICEALQQQRDKRIEAEKSAKLKEAKRREEAAAAHAKRVEEARNASVDDLIDTFWGKGGVRRFRPRPFFSSGIQHIEDAERLKEVQAECDRRNAELDRKLDERKQKQREYEAREAAVRAAWIDAYGSKRLQRLVAEDIEHTAVYLDERLKADRPGWRWTKDVAGSDSEPRNAPEAALDLLDEARATVPEDERADVKLVYWIVEACDADHDYDDEDECPGYHEGWRGYAAKDCFLDHDVIFGGPEDE